MSGKKKVILFLGAVSLIAFGNYKQFTKNKVQTAVEGKTSERATSSANGTAKEGKGSEKATSSAGNGKNQNSQNKEPMAEVKSVQKPQQPAPQTQNKPATPNTQTAEEKKAETSQNSNTQKSSGDLKMDSDVKDKFKLDTDKK